MDQMLTKHPIKLKDGNQVAAGCVLRWNNGEAFVVLEEQSYRIFPLVAAKVLGMKVPSLEQLKRWSDEGVCESILGERIEPDGIDNHGSPSWMLAMNII